MAATRTSTAPPGPHTTTGASEGQGMSTEDKLERAGQAFVGHVMSDLIWYALLAGAAWLVCHVAFRRALRKRRVSRQDPSARQVGREVLHSLRSVTVFGLVTGAVIYAYLSGWTRLYWRVGD